MAEQVWKVKEPGISGGAKFAILCLMLMCFGAGFWMGTSRPTEAETQAAAKTGSVSPNPPPVIDLSSPSNPIPPPPHVGPVPAPLGPTPVSTVSVKLPTPAPVPEVQTIKKPEPEIIRTKLIKNVTPTPVPPAPPVVAAPVKTPVGPLPPAGFNFALKANGASATGGATPDKLIDGNFTDYDGGNGFAYTNWSSNPPAAFLITFKDTPTIDCIRFLLWDKDTRFYRYKLEICPDAEGKNWSMAADFSKGKDECRSWQMIRFTPQPVKQIRLTGTFNSANSAFHVVELQASMGVPQGVHVPQEMDF